MSPAEAILTFEPETTINQLVNHYGADLSENTRREIIETIRCESGFVPQQSKHITKSGVRERSFGIVQIHLPSHPAVTEAQAMDVDYSVQFITEAFRRGQQRWWTCWRQSFL